VTLKYRFTKVRGKVRVRDGVNVRVVSYVTKCGVF